MENDNRGSVPKIHEVDNLIAYYNRDGRKWWVEEGENKSSFETVELMVAAYPNLEAVRSIRQNMIRREVERKEPAPPVKELVHSGKKKIEAIEECYYCSGSGMAGFMPCDNCDGKGSVKISNWLS